MEKTTRATRSLWVLTLVTLELAQARTRMATTWLLKTFSSHNLTKRIIAASIACFIEKDLRPYGVVESDGFPDMPHL